MDAVIRRALPFVAVAVLLGAYFGGELAFSPWMLLLPGLCIVLLALCLIGKRLPEASWPLLLCLAAGLALASASLAATPPSLPPEQKTTLTGRVDSPPQVKEDRVTLYLRDVRLADGTQVPGRVWLYYAPHLGEEEPPPIELPAIGQQVQLEATLRTPGVARNPGGFDFSRYLRRQGAYLAAYAYEPWHISGRTTPHPATWMAALRTALVERLGTRYGGLSPYLRGMILGDKDELNAQGRTAIRGSGLSHLLSVSGLHVGFVALPILWLLNLLQPRRWLRLLLLALTLGAYCLLVGAPAATVRACILVLISQGARAVGRRYDPLSALSAAFLLFLIFQPLVLWDSGFLLSMSAVLGIILLGPRFERLFRRLPAFMRGTVSVSLGAQLGCMPFVAKFFGEAQVLALLTNLFAVPLAGVVVLSGLGSLLLSYVWMPLAAPFSFAASLCMRVILWLAEAVSSIPFATLRIPAPHDAMILCWFIAMALCSGYFALRPRWRAYGVGAACAVVAGLWIARLPAPLLYIQVDVGQGDAAILRSPGHTLVIDTGEQGSGGLLDTLRYYGWGVDTLIVSHTHSDHAGALADLLEEGMPVGRIYIPAETYEGDVDEAAAQGLRLAAEKGVPIDTLAMGGQFSLPGGVEVEVLGPNPALSGDTNDRSLMLRVEAGGVSILTCGDAGEFAEPLRGVRSDILKASHHGSRYSSGEVFLRLASPEVVLISAGVGNVHGHPAPAALERIEAAGADIYRTDLGGALTLDLQKRPLAVKSFLKESL